MRGQDPWKITMKQDAKKGLKRRIRYDQRILWQALLAGLPGLAL